MTFIASTFKKTYSNYSDSGYHNLTSDKQAEVRQEMDRARDFVKKHYMTQEKEKEENDGFMTVKNKHSKQIANIHLIESKINVFKTGSVMVGFDSSNKLIYKLDISGNKKSDSIDELRKHLDINLEKPTYCSEEAIIANFPHIRFLASSAFRIDSKSVLYPIKACGYDSKEKCKLMLSELYIYEIDWS